MTNTKHSQDIVRELEDVRAHSNAVNRLLADIDSLKSEVWLLRTSLFVAVLGLILLSIDKAFGG